MQVNPDQCIQEIQHWNIWVPWEVVGFSLPCHSPPVPWHFLEGPDVPLPTGLMQRGVHMGMHVQKEKLQWWIVTQSRDAGVLSTRAEEHCGLQMNGLHSVKSNFIFQLHWDTVTKLAHTKRILMWDLKKMPLPSGRNIKVTKINIRIVFKKQVQMLVLPQPVLEMTCPV